MTDPEIYTLGYAGRSITQFLELLKSHGIQLVVDVRRYPRSKYPGFSREQLESLLAQNGIRYLFLGDKLGGFRGGYAEYTRSPDYRSGIQELVQLAAGARLAIICRERDPRACHRRYISQSLVQQGIQVIQL